MILKSRYLLLFLSALLAFLAAFCFIYCACVLYRERSSVSRSSELMHAKPALLSETEWLPGWCEQQACGQAQLDALQQKYLLLPEPLPDELPSYVADAFPGSPELNSFQYAAWLKVQLWLQKYPPLIEPICEFTEASDSGMCRVLCRVCSQWDHALLTSALTSAESPQVEAFTLSRNLDGTLQATLVLCCGVYREVLP